MSSKEFYEYFIDGAHKPHYELLLEQVQQNQLTSFGFMQKLFSAINISAHTYDRYIAQFPLYHAVQDVVSLVEKKGGTFSVISAGSCSYIRPILERHNLGHLPIFANPGRFHKGNLYLDPPTKREYRCSYYGISKEAVLRDQIPTDALCIYAGDGSSDFRAASCADIRFARSSLARRLSAAGLSYYPFESYDHIYTVLQKEI
ncbi:2,3-diketo-5-methylthio-1-phosphopentane phosphatase [Chitinivibrio alkaliphilus ACht1]|uniref:2,3-diketo-5-methylthio-1-phosphopentane phosphatase n=2 Tax=Chitinivibrio TaxID=1505231 RepID=U7D8F3_9BACT|nr:2,3-diketo-5-methylthio-1-phosphopentane phosphatase [Chitinivibrio alkaliphilus ACht1]